MKSHDRSRRSTTGRIPGLWKSRSAFLAGPLLTVLLFCLSISLILGKSLYHAQMASRDDMDSIRAYLAFERTLLALDLQMETEPFSQGGFRVVTEAISDPAGVPGLRVRLMDRSYLVEEAWLKGKQ